MKVRICYSETATGCDYNRDVEIAGDVITLRGIMQAINKINQESIEEVGDQCTIDPWVGVACHLLPNEKTAAFIAQGSDPYFGHYLITGRVYTEFR